MARIRGIIFNIDGTLVDMLVHYDESPLTQKG